MPAPMPITIRYGQDPMLLGGLAQASGQAAYDRQVQQQNYANWLRQHEMDQQFITANLNRETALTMQDNARRSSPSLVDSGGYARKLAQQSGTVTSTTGRQKSPTELAIEDERLRSLQLRNDRSAARGQSQGTVSTEGRDPSMSMTLANGDEFHTDSNGRILTNPSPDMVEEVKGRGVYTSRGGQQVTPEVKAQLDYLAQSALSPQQTAAFRTAVMSGGLKMEQLIDDVHAASGKGTDKWGTAADELNKVASLSPADQAAYARRKLHLDPLVYPPNDEEGDKAALQELGAYARQVEAMNKQSQPIQNSGGKTPTGGNVIPMPQTTDRATLSQWYSQIPQGAWYVNPSTGQPAQKR